MRCTPLIAAVTAALALTACGSTVQLSEQQALEQGSGGLGVAAGTLQGEPAPGEVTGVTGASGDGGGGTVDAGVGTGGRAASGGGTTTSAAGSAGGTVPCSGSAAGTSRSPGAAGSTTTSSQAAARPGTVRTGKATGSPVQVGVVIYPDVQQAAAAFGSTADVGNQKGEVESALAWVNANGGYAGHVVKPVYFEVQLTSTQTYAQTYQAICAKFTEDNKVIAAVVLGNAEAGLPACLAKGRALLLTQGHYLRSSADYAQFANLVTPGELDSDRVANELVDLILERGMAKKGETVGLLVMNYPAPRRARDRIVLPRLKKAGIEVVSYEVGYPQSTPDVANSASAVQSAQLAMAARGVKTVTFLCPGCVNFFLDAAEQQAYYPKYALTSYDTLAQYEGKERGRSLAGSVAVGWEPIRDTNTFVDRGKVLAGNATFGRCKEIQKEHLRGDASLGAAITFCGTLLSLKAASDTTDGTLSVANLARGFESLASTTPYVGNFSTRFAPGQRWGTASFRTMRFDAAGDRFVYDAGAAKAF